MNPIHLHQNEFLHLLRRFHFKTSKVLLISLTLNNSNERIVTNKVKALLSLI